MFCWQKLKLFFGAGCCFQLFVITHGFRPGLEEPSWAVDMAKAINRSLPEPEQEDEGDIEKSVVTEVDQLDPEASQQFILFDWSKNSWAAGAAKDKQVAGKLYELVYERILQHKERTGQPLDIHFIGHSRGAYVNAQVIRTLRKKGDNDSIGFLQMTVLDAQRWGDDGKLDANPGGIVDWTHNYYQRKGSPKGLYINSALNVDLTSIVEPWPGRPLQDIGDESHAEVHDWYHWIFDISDQNGQRGKDDYSDKVLGEQLLELRQQWQAGMPRTREAFYQGPAVIVENFSDGKADGFSLHGVASVKGKELELTPSQVHSGGSAFYTVPLSGDFAAEFTFRMVEPNNFAGADGLTFTMLNADTQKLGALGGQLGYAGLPGVAIAFDTYFNPEFGDEREPWRKVSLRVSGSAQWQSFSANKVPEPLNSGNPFRVRVTVKGQLLGIAVYSWGSDQATYLEGLVPSLPARKLVGFTAATGTGSQRHLIDDVIIVPGTP